MGETLVEQIESCGLQVTALPDGGYQVAGLVDGRPVEIPDSIALSWWWAGAAAGLSLLSPRIDYQVGDGAHVLTVRSWWRWLLWRLGLAP